MHSYELESEDLMCEVKMTQGLDEGLGQKQREQQVHQFVMVTPQVVEVLKQREEAEIQMVGQ